jgi:poly-gamma-glutamate capsule biosynthesis protein CapA/YwtB (metallophosphatase superfamily)
MSFSLCLTGDILPTRRLLDPPSSASAVYDLLHAADFAVGNFEMPLTRAGAPLHKLLNIRAAPEIAADVPLLGVDAVTVANNHVVDYGWAGLHDTHSALSQAGIAVIGVGENSAAAMQPAMREVAGVRIGVVAFSCLTPTGMGASKDRPGISAIHVHTGYEIDPWYQMEEPGDPSVVRIRTTVRIDDLAVAVAAVVALRARCDILVVTIHWGFGSGEDLAEYQLPLGQALIEAGADVVHGHHPHAIHAIGFHRGKPILFSAGTFIGQQVFLDASPAVKSLWAGMSPDGYVAALRFAPGAPVEIVLHPTTLDADRLPTIAVGADFDRIASRLVRLSAQFGAAVRPEGGCLRVSATA